MKERLNIDRARAFSVWNMIRSSSKPAFITLNEESMVVIEKN
jgi:hypothetical protein